MSVFKRLNTPVPRTVPTFYPAFYRKALERTGKPISDANILALAEFTAANLTLNAHVWFDAVGDPSAKRLFMTRFKGATYDPNRLAEMPDDMIDFLWAWNERTHPALHDFVRKLARTVISRLKDYGDVLPMGMWEDE